MLRTRVPLPHPSPVGGSALLHGGTQSDGPDRHSREILTQEWRLNCSTVTRWCLLVMADTLESTEQVNSRRIHFDVLLNYFGETPKFSTQLNYLETKL